MATKTYLPYSDSFYISDSSDSSDISDSTDSSDQKLFPARTIMGWTDSSKKKLLIYDKFVKF